MWASRHKACPVLWPLRNSTFSPSSTPTIANASDVGLVRAGCSAGQVLSLAGGERASTGAQDLALKLLCGERLSEEEAYRLGRCLFDLQEPSTVLRCSAIVTMESVCVVKAK